MLYRYQGRGGVVCDRKRGRTQNRKRYVQEVENRDARNIGYSALQDAIFGRGFNGYPTCNWMAETQQGAPCEVRSDPDMERV